MSRHTRSKRNRRSRNAKALRRAVVGLIASAGAFLVFGMTPLAMTMTPSAHADEFDVIIDPIINSISSIDPTLAVDMTAQPSSTSHWPRRQPSIDRVSAAAPADSSSLGSLSDLSDVSSASAGQSV